MATLLALACGNGLESGLLHGCRFSGFGREAYGVDAIVESFRRDPMALSAASESIEAAGHLAVFGTDAALIADVHGGGIARLWRIGAGPPSWPEPHIDVPFDPCLAQAGGDVAFATSDHPALTPEAGARVLAIGRSIMHDRAAASRVCVFVIRAFGDGDVGAALFAVHRLGSEPVRTAGFGTVGVLWRGDTLHRVSDTAGEAAIAAATWSPVVAETIDPSFPELDMPS